jgi:hypothetical protein
VAGSNTRILKRILCALQDEKIQVRIILALGVIHGLVFVFLIPPWQHYDEPGHFEYAKLIALQGSIPKAGDYDAALVQEIYNSTIKNNFFHYQGQPTPSQNITGAANRFWIPQVGDPPAYYWSVSWLIKLTLSQPTETQLYMGRLFSLVLFLLTIWASWRLTKEITTANSPLRWMVPAMLALLPGFVDIMTAFSNDPAAVMVFSLFLWASIRLIRVGLKPGLLLITILLVILCFFTKRTTWVAPILFPFVLILSIFHGRLKKAGWAIALLLIPLSAFIIFQWDDAALWYRDTTQDEPTRVIAPVQPLQGNALQVVIDSQASSPSLFQIVIPEAGHSLPGKTVTLGSWVWSNVPMAINSPDLLIINKKRETVRLGSPTIQIGTDPVFTSLSFRIPEDATRVYVVLSPSTSSAPAGKVYFAGPILVEGERPVNSHPIFHDRSMSTGEWGGPFTNLVRNADVAQAWPKIRSDVVHLTNKVSANLDNELYWMIDLLDVRGNSWFLVGSFRTIFRTFWGRFGWGNISMIGSLTYRLFELVTLLSFAGLGIFSFRHRSSIPWGIVIFNGISLLLVLFMAFYTGIAMQSLISKDYLPVARFILSMIVPISFALCAGWSIILDYFGRLFRNPVRWMPPVVFFGLFFFFDGAAIVSIARFLAR